MSSKPSASAQESITPPGVPSQFEWQRQTAIPCASRMLRRAMLYGRSSSGIVRNQFDFAEAKNGI